MAARWRQCIDIDSPLHIPLPKSTQTHPQPQPNTEGKPIPTELRAEEGSLRHEVGLEDAATGAAPRTHVDDEYALAGTRDPKVCVTTSRDPSSRLKQFMKEVKLVFPNAQALNRGNTKVAELVEVRCVAFLFGWVCFSFRGWWCVDFWRGGSAEYTYTIIPFFILSPHTPKHHRQACRTHDFTDIVVVQETRGQPDGLLVCHLPLGPTAYFTLSNVVMRHDIEDRGTVSEAYPHLIFDNFESPLGRRVADILKHAFPVPKDDARRVVTFANEDDRVRFRHHTFERAPAGKREVVLKVRAWVGGERFWLRSCVAVYDRLTSAYDRRRVTTIKTGGGPPLRHDAVPGTINHCA